jgi:hypothetical protein
MDDNSTHPLIALQAGNGHRFTSGLYRFEMASNQF